MTETQNDLQFEKTESHHENQADITAQRNPSSADWHKEPGSQRGEPTNSVDEMEDEDEMEGEIGEDQVYDDDLISEEDDDESSDDLQNREDPDFH